MFDGEGIKNEDKEENVIWGGRSRTFKLQIQNLVTVPIRLRPNLRVDSICFPGGVNA